MDGNNVANPSVDAKIDFKIDKLEDDNYVTWKWQLVNILKAKVLYKAVTEKTVDESINRQALALLGSALSQDNMALVVGCESAYEVWKRLELIFENKTTFEKQELLGKLHSYRIDKGTDLAKSIMEIQATASKLKLLGEQISDDALMSIILNGLPTAFETFIVAFKLLSPNERTLNHLISNVIAHSKTLSRDTESISLVANSRPSSTNNQNDICRYCKKPGHWARDCFKLQNKKKREQNPTRVPPTDDLVSFMANTSDAILDRSTWVADSGCSHHMSPNKFWFATYAPFPQNKEIQLGNGSRMAALGIGSIRTNAGVVEEVYYVPDSITNLFSIRAATQHGIVVQ